MSITMKNLTSLLLLCSTVFIGCEQQQKEVVKSTGRAVNYSSRPGAPQKPYKPDKKMTKLEDEFKATSREFQKLSMILDEIFEENVPEVEQTVVRINLSSQDIYLDGVKINKFIPIKARIKELNGQYPILVINAKNDHNHYRTISKILKICKRYRIVDVLYCGKYFSTENRDEEPPIE